MSASVLGLGELLEGGLEELRCHPLAVTLFVLADVMVSYLGSWAASLNINLVFLVFVSTVLSSPLSSLLAMALGGKLRDMVLDPIGLFVRLVFAIAVTLLVSLGAGIGIAFLIVPGLYFAARWTLAVPLVVLEECGIVEAMSRSWRLTESAAWPLVGTVIVLAIPSVALGLFGDTEPIMTLGAITFERALETLISSCVAAYGVAVSVFAYTKLAGPIDPLLETFA